MRERHGDIEAEPADVPRPVGRGRRRPGRRAGRPRGLRAGRPAPSAPRPRRVGARRRRRASAAASAPRRLRGAARSATSACRCRPTPAPKESSSSWPRSASRAGLEGDGRAREHLRQRAGLQQPQRAARARGQGLEGRSRARPSKWEVSADGLTWTFTLQQGLMWTNGDEVTADDYVASFQYAADPKHAWDFLVLRRHHQELRRGGPGRGADVARSASQVGADKYEVVFKTERPDAVPARDAHLVGAAPREVPREVRLRRLQHRPGDGRHVRAHSCSRSSARTGAWSMVANPKYTGKLKPMTDKLRRQHRHRRQRLRALPGRRDRLPSPTSSVGDLKAVLADPALKEQFNVNPGDFRSYYMFFDVTKAPFDDKKVRMAFAKAIDREAIVDGHPRPDWRSRPTPGSMPGFPDADSGGPQVDPGVRRRRGEGAPRRRRLPGRRRASRSRR